MPSTPFSSIGNGNFFHEEDRNFYSPSRNKHLKQVRIIETYNLYYHGRKLLLLLNDLQVFPNLLKFLVLWCPISDFKASSLMGRENEAEFTFLPPSPFSSFGLHLPTLLLFPPAHLPTLLCCLKPQFLLFPLPGPYPSPSLIFSSSPVRRFIFYL